MSYLASPPETPISIDGGIQYQYVIAQQGAIGMAVVADAHFTFVLSLGEPATLQLTYTGTVLSTPQYKTVTVNLTSPSGTVQAHSPQFQILGTGSQRVPNITTINSRRVAPNQSLAIQISTDIAATSYAALNLPAGMSVNTATGLITGTAPTNTDFAVITLQANNASYHYNRYFVLIVGKDGTSSTFPNAPFFFP